MQSVQERVAVKDPEHLIRWLRETRRDFVIFEAADLVRSQAWPHGVEALMQIIASYGTWRSCQETDDVEQVVGKDGRKTEVRRTKTEVLELEEMDRCVRWLIAQIVERDPTWTLDKPAL